MLVALVDYDSGNLHSAEKAFQRMAAEVGRITVTVTSDPDVVARADRIVLPGDGAFPACREALESHDGLFDAISEAVRDGGRPFLGICVGMQMLATRGLEYEPTPGFDWISGEVRKIAPADPALKVPHMGWNELRLEQSHPVLDGIGSGEHVYFVHSYQLHVTDPADRLASADYGGPVTAIVGRDNVIGTQFHPEKSQETGLRLIQNFLDWRP
ncbi:imidazole glycerol phosphate synthase subunit HisH [Haematobacter massiliensis]|uniref:Imidazole glycerol phosphate synthase subunit HisH n=1 Tax=Haematobacter massiliensis TaxID=195105 RepID=A0A086Y070_9RHOB|nr:imidazole glycerol phosphate synthase subunit HisH [Haematobacter massiliensis]KFI27670.1 imidazole glycerol phosphate synthase subunit HisH [Haematobacter massiliensis]OWJ71799.1 imidazole glycerol phosphate synthase subunit HisH [Haematobacter massiliensis]OWJ83164.1 imidazole glycerol phosphate synthase subunit HisH [Haematobacter massiliensis]QBJ23985.1 imidazole glycerol phosphate synthase subunit HisH [Haematobacter massiliensis]